LRAIAGTATTPDAEAVVIETPGAGGYGPPSERAPAALREDYRSGKFSREFLRKNYGYDPEADRNTPAQ